MGRNPIKPKGKAKTKAIVPTLNPKQIRFCKEYVVDCNGKQAAIRAGYSKKTAAEQAARLLTNVNVKKYIQWLQDELSEKTGVKAEDVIKEFALIAFANIQDFIQADNEIVDISKIARDKAAAVESIQTTVNVTTNKKGSKEYETQNIKLKMHSKLSALENLGKHLGVFREDNQQKGDSLQVLVDTINAYSHKIKINEG
jgi:phage terminase small subunit